MVSSPTVLKPDPTSLRSSLYPYLLSGTSQKHSENCCQSVELLRPGLGSIIFLLPCLAIRHLGCWSPAYGLLSQILRFIHLFGKPVPTMNLHVYVQFITNFSEYPNITQAFLPVFFLSHVHTVLQW